MENEETNLNTESNDIAGNRIDGPVGNTAAKPTAPNAGVGIPGGAPHPAAPDPRSPEAPASSESLADSEISVGAGAVEANPHPQENKEANPADLTPGNAYGGNFSNSTQSSYHDQARRDNQDSDPNRGEFGAQSLEGTTHGGFGNQNRQVSYEPRNSAEDQYYGGAGAPGPQDNAYRAYDGRDERADPRTTYGFELGTTNAPTSGQAAESGQLQDQHFGGPHGDNRNQPDRTDLNSAYQNDNGAAKGPDHGFSADYGHTSLAGNDSEAAQATASPDRRNQTEDYLPAQSGTDSQGHHTSLHAGYAPNPSASGTGQSAQRPESSQGYGDRGREEPRKLPDFATGDDRNGYVQPQANNGDVTQGIGSRGGSYNDAYDDSRPGSATGLPAEGGQRNEDTAANYGAAAREQNRPENDDDPDHGAPRRNAGRDGTADE